MENGELLREEGVANVTELDWGQSVVVEGVRVHCLPSRHWSKRGIGDDNRALWSAWAVTGPERSFYFAGDTGFFDGFARVAAVFRRLRPGRRADRRLRAGRDDAGLPSRPRGGRAGRRRPARPQGRRDPLRHVRPLRRAARRPAAPLPRGRGRECAAAGRRVGCSRSARPGSSEARDAPGNSRSGRPPARGPTQEGSGDDARDPRSTSAASCGAAFAGPSAVSRYPRPPSRVTRLALAVRRGPPRRPSR